MAGDVSKQDANVERAARLVQTGLATLEQAAAQCGLEPAVLRARLSASPPGTAQAARKKTSRFEVNFWLPFK